MTSFENLQAEVRRIALAEGENATDMSFAAAWRFTERQIQMPKTSNPYIYIVLDGMLRLYTPSGIMDYMAGQYSLSRIDTPISGTVLAFSDKWDFTALSVEFAVSDIISTVLDLDNSEGRKADSFEAFAGLVIGEDI